MVAVNPFIILFHDQNRQGVFFSCVWCVSLLVPFHTFYHFQSGKGSGFGAKLKDQIMSSL